jgi:hypothetical protein
MATTNDDLERNSLYTHYKNVLESNKVDITDKQWYEKLPKPEAPKFEEKDVTTLLKSIDTHTTDNGWKEIAPGIKMRFYNA